MKKLILLSVLSWQVHSFAHAQQVGLDVQGRIQLGDNESIIDEAGMIKWDSTLNDFLGFNGTEWLSLTQLAGHTNNPNTVTDIDGNVYTTVSIGFRTWMRENLRTTRFSDGTLITEAPLNTSWNQNLPRWSWIYNDPKYDLEYGKLYNFYALDTLTNGNRNICPEGWKVPDGDAILELLAVLNISVAGNKMKEVGTTHWPAPNSQATNESGFTGFPQAFRHPNGSYSDLPFVTYWFYGGTTSSEGSTFELQSNSEELILAQWDKNYGYPIRCIEAP